ncbi:MAG TPA: tetratricopeptide repeat protein [Chthonomonadaceae bacterium]|nr:tetratricopeptide repeat protein [Chthonomonadaceae bacterium]
MTDDCRYCPQCGQPTALAAEAKSLPMEAATHTVTGTRVVASTGNRADALETQGTFAPAGMAGAADLLKEEALRTALTRANLFRLRGQWEEAVERCIEVLRAQPGNPAAHSLLGDIYRDQGKTDDAIQWYRMALELRPNPADEAKLRDQERLRARLLSAPGRRLAGSPAALTPVSPDGDGAVPAGTAALLGISPRRWLLGITLTSVVFLILMVVALLAMQSSRRHVSPIPQPAPPPAVIPAGNVGSMLPPPNPGAARTQGSLTPSTPPIENSGTGLPPDRTSAPSSDSSHHPPQPQEPNEQSRLPLAPVNAVVPLSSQPSAQPGEGLPGAAAESALLEGGMRIADTQKDAASGVASVKVTAPSRDVAQPTLLRNAYRAARSVLSKDTSLTRVRVLIQAEPDASGETGSESPLLFAEIDRLAADLIDPSADSVERMASYLHFLPLPGQGTEGEPTPSSPESTQSADAQPSLSVAQ